MAETKATILDLYPDKQKLRDTRTYTEPQVKKILFSFARDLDCKWRADKLRRFIDTAFDFD